MTYNLYWGDPHSHCSISYGHGTVEQAFTDEPEQDVDVYRLQVAQRNGQWAWLTPVWVER